MQQHFLNPNTPFS